MAACGITLINMEKAAVWPQAQLESAALSDRLAINAVIPAPIGSLHPVGLILGDSRWQAHRSYMAP